MYRTAGQLASRSVNAARVSATTRPAIVTTMRFALRSIAIGWSGPGTLMAFGFPFGRFRHGLLLQSRASGVPEKSNRSPNDKFIYSDGSDKYWFYYFLRTPQCRPFVHIKDDELPRFPWQRRYADT